MRGWGVTRWGPRGFDAPAERPCAKLVFEYGPPEPLRPSTPTPLRPDDARIGSYGERPHIDSREIRTGVRSNYRDRNSRSSPVHRLGERGRGPPHMRENRDELYSRRRSPSPRSTNRVAPTRLPVRPAIPKPKPRVRSAGDIFLPPLRNSRPPFIALILRGLPGSGKSQLCRVIKDLEATHGTADEVRIMSIDDYFLVENEVEVEAEGGRKIKKKCMVYEHDAAMEANYEASLLKAFTKQLESRHFALIVVDAPNVSMDSVNRLATAAKENQYTVLVMEAEERDPKACHARNVHNRKLQDIEMMSAAWEDTTAVYVVLDPKGLREEITEVEMEDEQQEETVDDESKAVIHGGAGNGGSVDGGDVQGDRRPKSSAADDEDLPADKAWSVLRPSKWETNESTEEKLSRLDGGGYKKGSGESTRTKSMEEFLAVADDYETRASGKDGKRRVRWADIEERKQLDRAKAIGFVVGQTNWSAFTNADGEASAALNKTKYFDTEVDDE